LLENNELRRFINIYINDEDVRFMGSLAAQLKAGDSVTILPAVAGGCE
jgi:molybdopterin converting factor small subunit